jgi:hypothetical protein
MFNKLMAIQFSDPRGLFGVGSQCVATCAETDPERTKVFSSACDV